MTSLTFDEHMSGFVTFGASDFNEGLRRGRAEDSGCAFTITITIADVDAFLADPDATATVSGSLTCGGLGGVLSLEGGRFRLFVQEGEDARHQRMHYRLFAVTREKQPFTLIGFKDIADGQGFDIWTDTSTLFVRLVKGHVEEGPGSPEDLMASGILTLTHPAFMKMLASMHAEGGSPWRRTAAKIRYQRAFAGMLFHVYGGRARGGDQPDFVTVDPFRGQEPGDHFYDIEGHKGLRRRIFPLTAGDRRPLTLHNIRAVGEEPTRGPVMCLHGTSVRGDIFVGPPGGASLAQALVAEGYDVWIPNWRASIDFPPCVYTLDEGAVYDHPAAIEAILRETGSDTLKAVVHCQGSTSFSMAALAGLVPQVTHVVSSAVSVHTVSPLVTRIKGTLLLPFLGLRMKYVSAQWGVRAPSVLSRAFARMQLMARRECDNPVCAVANGMYGTGPDVLWVHEKLGTEAHEWASREFGYVPYRFLRQIYRSTLAGHIVTADKLAAIPKDLMKQPLPGGRWTFIAGTKNRAFLPVGQERTHAWFEERSGNTGKHTFAPIEGYGHLDPIFGPGAPRDVYPKIIAGLAD